MQLPKKAPDPIDKHVGLRIRTRRLMLTISQETLGDKLGLTFQQVQKYEKGTNRVSASKLQHIAHVLQVPVEFFFEGQPEVRAGKQYAAIVDPLAVLGTTRDGLALATAFNAIEDTKVRSAIVAICESHTHTGKAKKAA